MIRTLLATTAIATLLASGAVAQTTAPADPSATTTGQQDSQMTIRAEGHLASNLMGEQVYNSASEDAENIGEVQDLVISNDGNIEAIVVGVGGFLGIGQKEVALEYDLVQWSEQPDGERWIVVETTEDALRAQQEFDRTAFEPMPADADVAVTKPATQEDLASAPTQEGEQESGSDGDMAATSTDNQAGGTSGGMAAAPSGDQSGETSGDMAAAPTEDRVGESGDMAATETDQAGQTETEIAVVPTTDESDTGTDTAASDTAATDTTDGATGGAVATAPTTDQNAGDQNTQTAQQDQQMNQGAGTDQTQTGAIDRNNLQQAPADQLRAENLTGTTVYGANEENVGEVGDVILTPEGEVDALIVDVGGFLGIGEKEVAIGMDNLSFMTDQDGDLYLFTEFTQEELESQPAYDESTYAENRDQMRMSVQ